MFSLFFGRYLIEKNRITKSQYDSILEYQRSIRVKLGLIAVAEKVLTQEQAEEINRLQATMDKRFGDIAIEKGYLNELQVQVLLGLQGDPYLAFTQSVVDLGIMTVEEMEEEIEAYKEDENFTDDEIHALKSGDIDLISRLFLKTPDNMYYDHASLTIRNINRFISTDIYMKSGYVTNSYKNQHIAIQELDGQHKIFVAFAGEENSLLIIANTYGKEEFEDIDEDSYDSVCEFINVINGLFASKLSEEDIDVDMLPPDFKDDATLTSNKEFYVLPLSISGNPVDFILGIDHDITIS